MSVPSTGRVSVLLASGRYYFDGTNWTADVSIPPLVSSVIVDALQAIANTQAATHWSAKEIAQLCLDYCFPDATLEVAGLDAWSADDALPGNAID